MCAEDRRPQIPLACSATHAESRASISAAMNAAVNAAGNERDVYVKQTANVFLDPRADLELAMRHIPRAESTPQQDSSQDLLVS